ncbi:MAG: hypothetical protein NC822_00095 [Candidatus Omnitrophica bacterium]|nr:hypothetical protein [Candidatus Omnitrophota bacterium]MCM8826256.1 hypothetical protein [Candidatus Omnitrophota bacterium]
MIISDLFILDNLSKLVATFISFFILIILIYSFGYIKERKFSYYFWFLITGILSIGVVFTRNVWIVISLWGFLGFTLFQLINLSDDASSTAKKTFIIVGGSDGLMLLGFILYAYLTSSLSFNLYVDKQPLIINNGLALLSFIFIALGCFAKAGAIPLHTWIPDVAKDTTVPVVAYLPASLDKLLGIYLLARIVKDTFILDNWAKIFLLIIGSSTVIFAVMMALIQHNIKRLLGYHAVSQVGYMILGITSATSLGLASGLFHMVNHAIYKSCLFLCAGNVEKQSGSSELEDLGGIGKFMPLTFLFTLIASFSISGIPPFNGFVSKWMIYQSLLDLFNNTTFITLKVTISLSLVMALVGSGLTLASFLKLISSVFLGKPKKIVKEVGFSLYFPPFILSLLCIIFGLFAYSTILKFIEKGVGEIYFSGLWRPLLSTGLIVSGIILGLILFFFSARSIRYSSSYIGGEVLEDEVKSEDFYNTIKDLSLLKKIYNSAENKYFDIYDQGKRLIFLLGRFLSFLHNGVLPTYLVWCLIGMLGLLYLFFR